MFRGFCVAVNHGVSRRTLCTRTRTVDDCAPLHGVKVLDLTRVIAGPMCTIALADLGAEIIKVEVPQTGDFVRTWPPLLKDPQLSCTFVAMNRNKKSLGVNFQTAEGQDILRALAQKCDVLLENYVPGVLAKYALDYESLKSIAPQLIYCSLTGYGSEGPYSRKSGVDLIAASMSGHLYLTGPENGEPCKPGTSSIDIMAGLWAHGAIAAALHKRVSTKCGCKIDVDLLSTGIAALAHIAGAYLNSGQQPLRRGTEHENVVPYKSFKTKDGYVTTGAINDAQFRQLCKFLGVPELAEDERFSTSAKRVINRRVLLNLIEPLFQERTTKEWCDLLDSTSLPHGPLNDIAGITTPPTLRLRCRKPKSEKSVSWNEGIIDNEHMNKKKSKCCCIYKKPKQRFDESSESESDECENCFGHVEVKKQKQSQKLSQANNSCCVESSAPSSSAEITLDHAQPINSSGITMVSS